MNSPFSRFVFVFVVLGLLLCTTNANAQSPDDILVVGNKTLSIDKVSIEELRSIFLKKKTVWAGGGKVKPINAEKSSAERKKFTEKIIGMPQEDEKRYWQDQKVRHSLTPPKEVSTKKHERLRKVFSTKGSISYVFRKDYLDGVVKILLVIPQTSSK